MIKVSLIDAYSILTESLSGLPSSSDILSSLSKLPSPPPQSIWPTILSAILVVFAIIFTIYVILPKLELFVSRYTRDQWLGNIFKNLLLIALIISALKQLINMFSRRPFNEITDYVIIIDKPLSVISGILYFAIFLIFVSILIIIAKTLARYKI